MKDEKITPSFDDNEQEILSLLREIQDDFHAVPSKAATPVSAPVTTAETADPVLPASPEADMQLPPPLVLFMEDDEPDDTSVRRTHRARPEKKPQQKKRSRTLPTPVNTVITVPENEPAQQAKNKENRLHAVLRNVVPVKGDVPAEIVRKSVFLAALLTFVVSLCFLLYYMVLQPQAVRNDEARYTALYNDVTTNEETKSGYDYPAGMQVAFRQLYDINHDVAGWLSYTSTDAAGFLKINQPVVHCQDNATYLSRAFDGSKSRSGTLFFDKSNIFTQTGVSRVSIIYGHNMASGLMFARLNKLIGNVYYARSAPMITMNTLYANNQYKVLAVVLCDEGAAPERHFNYLRTAFTDDSDFLNYVAELRARSLYDYPVDVSANDELLILSTCTSKSQAKVADGRLAIVARRVRDGEEAAVDTTEIVDNGDVIMPYAWYTAQNRTPHLFYTQSDYHIPEDSTTTTAPTTVQTAETAAVTTGSTTGSATTASTAATSATTTPQSTAATAAGTTVTSAAVTAAQTTAGERTTR